MIKTWNKLVWVEVTKLVAALDCIGVNHYVIEYTGVSNHGLPEYTLEASW